MSKTRSLAHIFAAVPNYKFKSIMNQEQFAEPSLIPTCPTPSYSERPPSANHQQSISTCFTPSYSEQPSLVGSYHQSTLWNEHLTSSSSKQRQEYLLQ